MYAQQAELSVQVLEPTVWHPSNFETSVLDQGVLCSPWDATS